MASRDIVMGISSKSYEYIMLLLILQIKHNTICLKASQQHNIDHNEEGWPSKKQEKTMFFLPQKHRCANRFFANKRNWERDDGYDDYTDDDEAY